jgi:hypothetical protein
MLTILFFIDNKLENTLFLSKIWLYVAGFFNKRISVAFFLIFYEIFI